MNADLSVLRHMEGSAEGLVESPEFTEDRVAAFWFKNGPEARSVNRLYVPTVTPAGLEKGLRSIMGRFSETLPATHHARNIRHHLPHVQVLSTGRCGTVMLHRSFQSSTLVPYHAYWWMPSISYCWEAAYSAVRGITYSPDVWLSCRAAEWLGAISRNRAMAAVNHQDTAFAPLFATLHPRSRFVYLRREPRDIFASFYSKNQWKDNQLRPLHVGFVPFRFRRTDHDEVECIAWLIYFVETFSRALGAILGERWLEASSERLFAQDADEISMLADHCKTALDRDAFAEPVNVKAHKATRDAAPEMARFDAALAKLRETGRL